MKKIAITFFTFFLISITASAKFIQNCKVKYKRSQDWSEYYDIKVTFMGGTELNRETSSLDYDNFSTYAIIFWGEEEASVIKISSFTGCDGQDATKNCIVSGLNLEGRDQNGRVWEICTINACI